MRGSRYDAAVASIWVGIVATVLTNSVDCQTVISKSKARDFAGIGSPVSIVSINDQGVATAEELNQAVGELHFFMTACRNGRFDIHPSRELTVRIQKPSYAKPAILDALLLRAAQYAWDKCPLHFIDVVTGEEQPEYLREIAAVHVFYDGTEVLTARALCCDNGIFRNQGYYRWQQITDLGAIAKEEAARQQVLAEGQRAREAWYRTREQRSAEFWGSVGSFFKFMFAGFCCYGLWLLRKPVARWYYFAFYPHPATNLVHDAIAQGVAPLNGRALASAISDLPPGSRTLRQVRVEQGERLVALMQEATRERLARYEKQAKYEYERAAIASIQEAIGLAAIALERAKASFATSQSLGR
jgi:hypothetical protein